MNKHVEEHAVVIQSVTEALFILMETKQFSEITITELIKKAGIARSTYYRNFESKEDIVKTFLKQVFYDFLDWYPITSIEERYTPEYISHLLDYLPPYKKRIQILNKAGISSYYLVMLNEFLMELYNKPNMSASESFYIYTLAGAEYNLIFNWYVQQQHGNTQELKDLIKSSIIVNPQK